MLKMIGISFFLFSSLSFAQECPDLGWSNQSILLSALSNKSTELMDVKSLEIDSVNEVIRFKTQGSDEGREFSYHTCGEEISFSRVILQ